MGRGVKHRQGYWLPILTSSRIGEARGRNEIMRPLGKGEGREES